MSPETDLDKRITVAEQLAINREMALLSARCRGISMRLKVLVDKASRQGSVSVADIREALDDINLGLGLGANTQAQVVNQVQAKGAGL